LEVAVLARRRDEIANELSQLSGVIQALAVPETTSRQADGAWKSEEEDRQP
jgi:hypothetical protein